MSTLSGHIEYALPVGRTYSLAKEKGIEYSATGQQKVRLLDQMRQSLRSRHYSRRTERMYHQWKESKKPDGWFEE